MPATFQIRTFGDPVLTRPGTPVEESEWGRLRRIVEDMMPTMYAARGLGLAAPQVGVRKRFFVYDLGDDPRVVINPEIIESGGTFTYDEGCLSVPDLFFAVERANAVHLRGYDLDGNEIDVEADELLGRVFQHEIDHLDGILVLDRLDDKTRKSALKVLRDRALGTGGGDLPAGVSVRPRDRGL